MRQFHSTFRSAAQFPRLAALATNSHEELIMFVHAEFLIPTPPTDDTLFFPRSKVTKKGFISGCSYIGHRPCPPRGPGSMKAASKVPRRSKRAQFHRNGRGRRRRADDDRLGAATTGGGVGGGRNSTDNKQVSG